MLMTSAIRAQVQELANGWIERQGYFLISSAIQMETGEITDDCGCFEGVPLVVIGEVTRAEFAAQLEYNKQRLPEVYAHGIAENAKYFYRVTAE